MKVRPISRSYSTLNKVTRKSAVAKDSFADVLKKQQNSHSEDTFHASLYGTEDIEGTANKLDVWEYQDSLARMAVNIK